MKILVVYFSQTGNTEMVAKAVHERSLRITMQALKRWATPA